MNNTFLEPIDFESIPDLFSFILENSTCQCKTRLNEGCKACSLLYFNNYSLENPNMARQREDRVNPINCFANFFLMKYVEEKLSYEASRFVDNGPPDKGNEIFYDFHARMGSNDNLSRLRKVIALACLISYKNFKKDKKEEKSASYTVNYYLNTMSDVILTRDVIELYRRMCKVPLEEKDRTLMSTIVELIAQRVDTWNWEENFFHLEPVRQHLGHSENDDNIEIQSEVFAVLPDMLSTIKSIHRLTEKEESNTNITISSRINFVMSKSDNMMIELVTDLVINRLGHGKADKIQNHTMEILAEIIELAYAKNRVTDIVLNKTSKLHGQSQKFTTKCPGIEHLTNKTIDIYQYVTSNLERHIFLDEGKKYTQEFNSKFEEIKGWVHGINLKRQFTKAIGKERRIYHAASSGKQIETKFSCFINRGIESKETEDLISTNVEKLSSAECSLLLEKATSWMWRMEFRGDDRRLTSDILAMTFIDICMKINTYGIGKSKKSTEVTLEVGENKQGRRFDFFDKLAIDAPNASKSSLLTAVAQRVKTDAKVMPEKNDLVFFAQNCPFTYLMKKCLWQLWNQTEDYSIADQMMALERLNEFVEIAIKLRIEIEMDNKDSKIIMDEDIFILLEELCIKVDEYI